MALPKETFQKPGDYILEGPMLVGGSGKMFNFDMLVLELNIYQDIDTPYMSGSILISEASGLFETMPFLGLELLLFKLRTPGSDNSIDFSVYHAMVYNVGARTPSGNRQQTYVLNFTTLEAFKNTRTKISKSFKGNISQMIAEIMSDDTMLGTPKKINIDPTQAIRKYIAPTVRPFQVIQYLKEEAINENGEPHYVFYENPDGFHFRSLDSLLGELRELSTEAVQEFKLQPPQGTQAFADTMQSIQEIKITDATDSYSNGRAGMFNSTLYQHDILNKNVSKYVFDYETAFKSQNATNQDTNGFGPLVSDIKVDGKKKIWEFPDSRIFLHPSASSNLHNEGTSTTPEYDYSHNNAELWMQESISRELEREYFTVKIAVFGDTDVKVGDIINLVIPSNKPLAAEQGSDALDPILSGRYLITSLHHKVNVQDGNHAMFITAMKDSLVYQIATQKINIPDPPKKPVVKALSRKKRRKRFKTRTVSAIVGVRG